LPCAHRHLVLPELAIECFVDSILDLARVAATDSELRTALQKTLTPDNPLLRETYVCPTCGRWLLLFEDKVLAVWTHERGDFRRLRCRSELAGLRLPPVAAGATLEHAAGAGDPSASRASPDISCPACGNSDLGRMSYVQLVRNSHGLRGAKGGQVIQVEAEEIIDQQPAGRGEIECRVCYVTFSPPAGVTFFSYFPADSPAAASSPASSTASSLQGGQAGPAVDARPHPAKPAGA
jgi:predicted RNA-binding Zn-ribbon protein involved in translation (DUF1610 family)